MQVPKTLTGLKNATPIIKYATSREEGMPQVGHSSGQGFKMARATLCRRIDMYGDTV